MLPTLAGRKTGTQPEYVALETSVNIIDSVFGHDTFVGPWAEVRGARVGHRTRIQSHVFIPPGVTIGDDCFVGHGVVFTNDDFRGRDETGAPVAARDPAAWAKTHVGNHVLIGSNATILPVTICDNVVIGAGAVVTRDITQPGTYMGNPATASSARRR